MESSPVLKTWVSISVFDEKTDNLGRLVEEYIREFGDPGLIVAPIEELFKGLYTHRLFRDADLHDMDHFWDWVDGRRKKEGQLTAPTLC